MKYLLTFALLLAACSSDDTNSNNQTDTRCGAGEAVTADDQLACVYTTELIEEGFTCPSLVPTGFLLNGGGVACVAGEVMPTPLKGELEKLGFTPIEPTCFDAAPASTCFYNTTASTAFDLTGAETITYTAAGGFGFCIDTGNALDFTLNLTTREAVIGVGIVGDAAVDTCITQLQGDCIIRQEHQITLTTTQVDALKGLLIEVPAPMCVEDSGRVCDFCLIETLAVDSQSVDTGCCGETVTGFGASLTAVVEFIQTLVPATASAFANPTEFAVLTYTTGPGLGYCVEADMVLNATITRSTVDDSLSIEGTTAVIGDVATDTCVVDTIDGNCYVATAFGPMTLGATEQTAIESALGAVPAPMCVVDQGLACDPCLVTSIDLDGTTVDNNCCGTTAPGYDAAYSAVVASIEASH
jgi:hypothetical protein